MACGSEMTLMSVVKDDTTLVPGFEHHTFTCSECQDMEQRLVFIKHHGDGDTEPSAVQEAPSTAPTSTVQEQNVDAHAESLLPSAEGS